MSRGYHQLKIYKYYFKIRSQKSVYSLYPNIFIFAEGKSGGYHPLKSTKTFLKFGLQKVFISLYPNIFIFAEEQRERERE